LSDEGNAANIKTTTADSFWSADRWLSMKLRMTAERGGREGRGLAIDSKLATGDGALGHCEVAGRGFRRPGYTGGMPNNDARAMY
jgi:hypothetical protein